MKKKRPAKPRRPVVETLEPRILYSADFSPIQLDHRDAAPQAEQRTLDPSGEFTSNATQTHDASAAAQSSRHEVVFVDTAVPDYEKLVQDITANSSAQHQYDVVLLKSGIDGIKQITQTLAGMQDVSAVHIISHGTDGEVQLGGATLNLDSLLKNASQIKGWGQALAPAADILIYGCDVAEYADGKGLVNALGRLTGADVAASTDLTGAGALGGDWELEYHTGAIQAGIVVSAQEQATYTGILQGVAVGGETLVNTTTAGTQQTGPSLNGKSVAVAPDGSYVVVWSGQGPGGSGDTGGNAPGVFFQRFSAAGAKLGGEIQVNQTTANAQQNASIAMDANGNFVIAWAGNGAQAGNVDTQGVFFRRYNAAGVAQGGETLVNTTTALNQQNASIAMNANGNFIVAWDGNGTQVGNVDTQGVFFQRYNSAGVKQGTETLVNTTTALNQQNASIVMDANGNFIVAWDGNGTQAGNVDTQGVFFQRYNTAGAKQGTETLVNTTTALNQQNASIAMDANGNFIIAWDGNGTQVGNVDTQGVFFQRYNPVGVKQGTETLVDQTTANNQLDPSISMDTNGNFVVSWTSTSQPGDVAATTAIVKRDFNADGTANGGETLVNTTTAGTQSVSSVAMNAYDQYVVIWQGNGVGDASGVFSQSYAAALIVDTANDTYDAPFAQNTITISQLLNSKGPDTLISLREAIDAANNTANTSAPDRIYFRIPGAGTHTINLLSALPNITEAVTIDGYSQTGASVNTQAIGDNAVLLIELNGAGAGGSSGLVLAAGSSGSTLRGLVINRFTSSAIRILASSNNTVVGNLLGTNAAGTAVQGNQVGVYITSTGPNSTNNTVGGTTAADRNIISGNTVDGIQIFGSGTSGNVVLGNYIGLDVTGTVDLGNTNQGVAVFNQATNNTIGGTAAGAGNVISGNNGRGVSITTAGATGNVVQGNLIGTNAAGTAGVGNSKEGIYIDTSAANNTIGGTTAGAGNTIAYNTLDGVALGSSAGTGNSILSNSIYSNGGQGIDLAADGVSANDVGDGDAGANNLQNFPTVTAVTVGGGNTTVTGTFNSVANTNFRLEFFASSSVDPSGYGEGQVYLGFLNVTTNASGDLGAPFSYVKAGYTLPAGWAISATATRANATYTTFTDTSEFSGAVAPPVAADDAYSVNEDSTLVVGSPTTNLANWWKFDDGGASQTVVDSGSLGNNGTRGSTGGADANDPSWTAGYVGTGALSFDGSSDYVTTTSTLAKTASNFTLSAWFQTNTTSGQQILLWEGHSGGNAFGNPSNTPADSEMSLSVGTYNQDDNITFHLGYDVPGGGADPIYIVSNSTFTDTTAWHNATVSVSDLGGGVFGASLYVDGVLQGSDTGVQNDRSAWGALHIGAPGAATRQFDGQVDDVRVYDAALSPAQVQNIVQAGVLQNDSDADSMPIKVNTSVVTGPANGTLIISPSGSFIYTPNANFNGIDTFTYKATDGSNDSNLATVTITVNPVNDAPAGTSNTVTTLEDTAYTFAASDFGFTDPLDAGSAAGADALAAVKITTLPAAGTLTDNGVAVVGGQFVSVSDISTGKLKFTPAANANGAGYAAFTFQVQDDGGTASGGVDTDATPNTMTINVTAVNDAPTATNLSAAESYTEDTPLNLTNIVVSDVDSANVTAILTVSNVAAGSLTTATSGAVTSTYNAGTGVWTASGALADVNTLLAGVSFTPALNFNSNFTIATSVSDGVAAPITGSKAMTGTPVNDAPTATNLSAAESYTEDTPLNLTNIVVSDVDSANVTAILTVSNVAAGSLTTATSGAVTSTYNAGTGVWTASGALADVNTLLAGVSFTPALDFNSNFTIATSVSDGVAAPITGSKAMTGTPVNDAPSATNLSAAESYTEDTPLNLTNIVVSDVDSANVTAILTVSNVAAGSLTTATSGAVTSTYNAGTGVWTASGALADVNTLLAGVSFTPALDFNSNFTIATSVSDGVAAPITGSKAMTGTPVNDAPTATNLSAAESYTEDTPLNLTNIVVSDVDSANVTAILTVSNVAAGSLTTATSGAVTSTYNAGTGVWTASGALADVNTLLAGVSFTPALNFNSNFTIATSVSDGVAAPITGSKAMTGTPVNDAPTATNLSAAESYTEDTPLNLTNIVVSDVDSANVTAILTVSNVAAGSLTTATSGAVTSTYNAGTGVWTASGALADVNTLLAGVSFTPALDFNSNFTIATSVSDGVAAPITGSKAMTGTPVNDAPTATNLSAAESYTEDTPLNLTNIVVSDVDSANVTAILTVSNVAAGSLTTATSGAVTSTYNAGTGVWTASGALADVNALLAGVSFTPALDFNSNFTIATSVSDGVAAPITGSKAMTGTPVNDAPSATNLSAAESYTEDTPLNLTNIVVSDVDSANVTAILTVSNVAAGSLSTATSGAVTSTYNAGTGVWTASGALADVNTLLAGVSFTPALNFNSNFTIATSVSDGVAAPITGSKAMTGTPVNDAPALATGSVLAYTENQAATAINTLITTSDLDNATLTSGTVSISANFVSGEDVLGFTNVPATMGNIVGAYNAATGVMTLTSAASTATLAQWQAALRAVSYSNSSDNPSVAARTVSYTVNDGAANSNTITSTINVTAVNDAPTNTIPATQGTIQDTALVFSSANSNQISIADIDAASGSLEITLAATNGRITLNGVGGLAFTTGDGIADTSMTFTGVLANINIALNGLSFDPTTGFSGTASLSITANDQGNNGSGGAKTANNTVNIVVTGVPSATNDTYSVDEDSTITVSSTWYDANWQYREQLSFDNATRAENLVNFPVLVEIDTAKFGASFYGQAQAAGQDLRFVDANGTLLAHEIESWNPGGTSYVWVKVPQIDASSNSDSISMYWGNTSAADVQDGAAVWGNSYAGEWHFNGNVTDSTGLNTATDNGTSVFAGQVAAARDFNGTGAYVQTSSTILKTADSFTIGTWFKADATDYAHHLLWEGMSGANGFGDPSNPATNQEMNLSMGGIPALNTPTPNYLTFFLGDEDEPVDAGVLQISTPFTDTAGWHYVSVVVSDMSTAPSATMYLDGVAVGSDTGTLARTSRTNWDTGMRLGEPGVAARYYDGALDELNLATAARSANWVNGQYASMTGTLVSNSAVQARPVVVGLLANDTDPAGLPLSAVLVSGPSNAAAFTLNADGTFSYTPVADYNGIDTFTYQANNGSSNSNVATVTITVTSVNDAPIGTNNTVTTNEDSAYTFNTADFGFTDPNDSPANSLLALTITTLPTAGQLTNNGIAVTAGQTITLADITGGQLVFAPAADANGAGYAAFTFQVQDNGGTANGGVDLDVTPRTMTINVTAVNDAPVGTNNTVTTNEDTAYTFGVVDFGFTDPNDIPANTLAAVRIGSLPGTGSLTLSGVAVTSGQTISLANISAGNLQFTPSADANGAGYAAFTFQVQDNGGTANGGVNLDVTPRTMTVNVTAVNDAPIGTNNTVTTNEDSAYTFGVVDFGFSDPNDIPANSLLAVTITTLPTAGQLTNNGIAVTVGQSITLADITGGQLVFAPAADANGAGYAAFTFQVQDDGGTASGGVDTDATPNTMTINVTAVNDAPTATNLSAAESYTEDTPLNLTNIVVSDVDSANVTAILTVSNVAAGSLTTATSGAVTSTYNAGTGVWTASGALADVNTLLAGVSFTPALDFNSNFTIATSVSDGVAAPITGSKAMTGTPVNDAPTATNLSAAESYTEDTPLNLTNIVVSDVDSANVTAILTVSNVAAGSLTTATSGAVTSTYNAGTGVWTASGALADVNTLLAGVSFTPALNFNSNFTIATSVSDGVAAPITGSKAMTGTPVNDAPQAADNSVSTLENTGYIFGVADFGLTDPKDSPSDALLAVRINSLPGAGTLMDNGVAVTTGQFVSAADIAANLLVFTPTPGTNGVGYANFSFQVQDNGGTANGGVDLDTTSHTMTLNVFSVNDAPIGTNNTVTTNEDSAYTFNTADFGFTDPNDSPANSLLALTITTLPTAGQLTNNGIAVTAGQTITLADITGGQLVFAPAADANGAGYAAFTFQVQDNGGTANGGVDLDVTPRTMTINVTAVNDAPVGTNNTVTTNEDTAYTFGVVDFGFTDPNDIPANTLAAVRIGSLPGTGSLTLSGVAVTSGQTISLANISAGNLQFTPSADANGAGYAAFTFQVQDNGGTANGGVNLDVTPRTMTVNVTAVNDAPIGTNNTVTTNEDSAYTFGVVDFGFSDPNDIPANSLLAVTITTLPTAGQLTNNGIAVTVGQSITLADITGGQLVFAPAADANGAGYAAFTFQVQDDGGTASGGVDTDATPNTMTINVTAVNDAPTATNLSAAESYTEDTPLNLTNIVVSDVDSANVTAILTVSNVAAGSLTTATSGAVTSTYNAGTGVWTASGALADVNTLLAGVSFTPALDFNSNFTIATSVSDGVAAPITGSKAMTGTPVNDAPQLGNNTLTINQGGTVLLSSANLSATDVDSSVPALTFAVSNVKAGRFELVSAPGVAIATFTVADVTGSQVRFVQDGSSNAPSYLVRVSDAGPLFNGPPTAASIVFNVTPPVVVTPPPVVVPPPPAPPSGGNNPGQPGKSGGDSDNQRVIAPEVVHSPGRIVAKLNEMADDHPAEGEARRGQAAQPKSTLNDFRPRNADGPETSAPTLTMASLAFASSKPADWTTQSAFPNAGEEAPHDQIQILIDSVKMGGLALSVGVVWWASRISGLLGSLLASAPAWRHIDPLPVVGRDDDEDEAEWLEPDDRDADANELAVSLVLEGSHRAVQ